MRTSAAVTHSAGVPATLVLTVAIYLALTGAIIVLPWLMSRRWRRERPAPPDRREQARIGPVPAGSTEPVG
jgi:cytochrome d ubiquinol oxidase subunit I